MQIESDIKNNSDLLVNTMVSHVKIYNNNGDTSELDKAFKIARELIKRRDENE